MEDTSSYYFHCLELWAEATEMSWLPTGKTLTHRCPTGQLAILVGTWSKSWHSRWSTVGLETVAVSCYMVSLAGPGASFSWLLSVQLLSWPSLAFSRHHCCEWVHLRCIPLPLPTRGILVSFCCSTYLALCNLVSLDGCQYRWWREDCVYLCFHLKKSFINVLTHLELFFILKLYGSCPSCTFLMTDAVTLFCISLISLLNSASFMLGSFWDVLMASINWVNCSDNNILVTMLGCTSLEWQNLTTCYLKYPGSHDYPQNFQNPTWDGLCAVHTASSVMTIMHIREHIFSLIPMSADIKYITLWSYLRDLPSVTGGMNKWKDFFCSYLL